MNWGLLAVIVVLVGVFLLKQVLELYQYYSDKKFAKSMQVKLDNIQTSIASSNKQIQDGIIDIKQANIADHHKERLIQNYSTSLDKYEDILTRCESMQKTVDEYAARAAHYANKMFFWKKEKMSVNWHRQTME